MSASPAGFRDPRVLIPFIIITLIWGSTWIVIRDQLGTVPPTWSVTYRFMIAGAAMFAFALYKGASLRIGRNGHLLAMLVGVPQFVVNFNFVYAAEHHITSGLVAVVFALLMVPNSLLAWLFLKEKVNAGFLAGSAVAIIGIALLFVQEMRSSSMSLGEIGLGIGLTIVGVLGASVANTLQATQMLRRRPIPSMLAWSILYGVAGNAAIAFILYGPPVIEYRATYWAGVAYLGLAASAFAFTLYFAVIRAVGPGRAAYSSVIVPIIAMSISTIFEGYRWSPLALTGGALAMIGLVIALRARAPVAKAPVEAV